MLRPESSRRCGLLLRLLCSVTCSSFACVPLGNLGDYSVAPPDAGDAGQAGAASLPQPDAGGSGGASSNSDASSQSGAGSTSDVGDAGLTPPDGGMPVDAAASCTNDMGFVSLGSCYLVVAEAQTWTDGLASCEAWGGTLATLESEEENNALTATLEEDVWIGLNDRDQEGTFVWVGGQDTAYRPWADQQPNDLMGQDCVQRQQVSALWLDQACDEVRASLCERAL